MGRTDSGVRNRWKRMERAQCQRMQGNSDNGYRCRRCGQPKRGHICAALTQGERPEGKELEHRAAELTALSAVTMQAMIAGEPDQPLAVQVRPGSGDHSGQVAMLALIKVCELVSSGSSSANEGCVWRRAAWGAAY